MPQMMADDIRGQIVRGELLPGQAVPSEKQLMEMYGISRPTLREAMRILETEALIETVRGMKGGAIVRVPDPEVVIRQAGLTLQLLGTTVLDVYTARAFFEPPAARYLAETNGEKAGAELRTILERGRAVADEPIEFAKVAGLFHRRLVELCGNETLSLFAQVMTHLTDATYELTVKGRPVRQVKPRIQLSLRSWRKVIELIEAGQGEKAERQWRAHMAEVGKNPAFALKTAQVVSG